MKNFIPLTYSVESVTSGHPDKVCDQISDAILDAYLRLDPHSRVAVECLGGHGRLVIIGEVTSKAHVNAAHVAREVYRDIGYIEPLSISTKIVHQSPDIAQGVDTGGAGDQGIMYGYATNETEQFLPYAVTLVHSLTKGLEDLRVSNTFDWLMPDGKAQVTMCQGKIQTVLVSCQHRADISLSDIKRNLKAKLIKPLVNLDTQILVNPTGLFVQGGFEADTGLTGRKIMVDTYGGLIPHGGGCFSGKDATKVDRSAAYMCRFVAKNIVAHGLANECLVSVSYAIGKRDPLMVEAITESGKDLSKYVNKQYDFRPLAIIERLRLREPWYKKTASYGHFGRNEFPWEEIE